MPTITFEAARKDDEWAVPLNPAEVENELVTWSFDSAPRTTLGMIQVADGIAELGVKRDASGLYNREAYAYAHNLSYARVHLKGRAYTVGDKTRSDLSIDEIDQIPPEVLGEFVFRAENGLLKKKTGGATPTTAPKDETSKDETSKTGASKGETEPGGQAGKEAPSGSKSD